MSRKFDAELSRAARNTFENLAFMISLEEGGGGSASLRARRSVSVDFAGPVSGRLIVSVWARLMPAIAINMLGLEGEEPGPTQQEDAFKELVNVICGNLLPAIAGAQAVFAVGAPTLMADGEAPAASAQPPAAVAHLTLENGTAELALYVNESAKSDLAGSAAGG